jgi:DNA-binding NtrC family response regulator
MASVSTARQADRPFGTGGAVRVLLASDRVAARLALEAVLAKSGYLVESAVSAADAMERIEVQAYDLVLCDLENDCGELRRFAERQPNRPATATVHVSHDHDHPDAEQHGNEVLIEAVDVQRLLTQVAELVANRALGRAARSRTDVRPKSA